jgi:hypothetical protein
MLQTSLPWAEKYQRKYFVLVHHQMMVPLYFLVPANKSEKIGTIELLLATIDY